MPGRLIPLLEPGQGLVQGQDVEAGPALGQLDVGQFLASQTAAGLEALLVSGALDENPPHGLGRGGEEVAPAIPVLRLAAAEEPQVRLVDQGGGLERLAGPFATQLGRRDPAQLVVDQRQELLRRQRIALIDLRENARDVTHRWAS